MFGLEPIILASGSPRRAEILTAVGWEFEKDVPDVDESEVAGEPAADYVLRLAVEKASAIAKMHPGRIVLGSDTTVLLNGKILGKPVDLKDAERMIAELSGERHEVLTGVALVRDGECHSAVQTTGVTFAEMSPEEIGHLVRFGSPLDKAGGYAVQAQAALFIEKIDGDYWNVVGLPINLVYHLYREHFADAK
ncbi:MAG: septum formation protein Maf [Acidobacteria bacterium]|nr:septum formation protein Maf [Acidobacteriota bacterium]